jgi:hypothetical protein
VQASAIDLPVVGRAARAAVPPPRLDTAAKEDRFMLTSTVISDTNIVIATYDGALTAEEVIAVREKLAGVIAQHGNARMLVEYGDVDLSRMQPRAVWEDLKSAGLMRTVEKAAVLTDTRWVKSLSTAAGVLAPIDVRVYDTGQRAEALSWLQS